MADGHILISVPVDGEGYLGLVCPHCEGEFKVRGADWQGWEGTELHCALCGLSDATSVFVAPIVERQALEHGHNLLARLVNNSLGKLTREFRGSTHVKVTHTPLPEVPVTPIRAITDLAEASVACCETTVKVPFASGAALFYCPFCGQVQD